MMDEFVFFVVRLEGFEFHSKFFTRRNVKQQQHKIPEEFWSESDNVENFSVLTADSVAFLYSRWMDGRSVMCLDYKSNEPD